MFVPVVCSQCGKPFQVAEASVGQTTTCPWCAAAVLALPIGTPATGASTGGLTPPARQDAPPVRQPKLLSLDDEPTEPPRPKKPFPWWVVGAAVLALIAAAGATIAILWYSREQARTVRWKEFTPSDGTFTIELLERVSEDTERVPAGGKRFVSESAGLSAWVGWIDLDPAQVRLAATDDAWQHFRKLFDAERDRVKEKTGGTVVREATTKFKDPLTREVRIEYEGGRVVARMMVVTKGPRPRAYFVGMVGQFDPDGPEAKYLFDSFRVSE